MIKAPIAYVELPAIDLAATKTFYSSLFGWTFEDWGPDYASFTEGLAGGFNASNEGRPQAPLIVLETAEIEALEQRVQAAGGTITVPIFDFPGGRRFHFKDLSGQELAVMQTG